VEPLVLLLAVTVGVIGLAGRLPEARRVKRELARTRRVTISSLLGTTSDGSVVAVRGTLTPADATDVLAAPVTGRSCVYYRVTFDELGSGGDFRELGRAEGSVPFVIEADGYRVHVAADAPQLGVHGEVRVRSMRDFANAAQTDGLIQLARAACRRTPNHPRWSALRITEYVLTGGTTVTLKGVCTREPDPTKEATDAMYRDGERPTRPVLSGTRRAPLLIG